MKLFFDRLDALYQAGNQAAIEEYLLHYLRDLEKAERSESAEMASVLNELASYYRGISRYADAETQFTNALRLLENIGMQQSPQYATIVLNLAGVYRLMGEPVRAIKLFSDAKELLIACHMQSDYAYASVLNNLSLAYRDIGEHALAYDTALESYHLIESIDTGEHELATALCNLAVIKFTMRDYDKAETHVNEALAYYANMAEKNVHEAAALTIKASLLYCRGQYQAALDYFERALGMTYRFFGENIEYAIGESNISMVYEALGDYSTSLKHIKKALSLAEVILGSDHIKTCDFRESAAKLELKVQHL